MEVATIQAEGGEARVQPREEEGRHLSKERKWPPDPEEAVAAGSTGPVQSRLPTSAHPPPSASNSLSDTFLSLPYPLHSLLMIICLQGLPELNTITSIYFTLIFKDLFIYFFSACFA